MSRKFRFKSKKPTEKLKIFSCTQDIIDTDLIKGAHIELFSNRQIIVEGCEGVFDYGEEYIKLNLGRGSLILCGKEFDIVTFQNRNITVKGVISTIEFCVR